MDVSRIDKTEGASAAANIDPGRTREALGGQQADDCGARARLPKSTSSDRGQAGQSPEGQAARVKVASTPARVCDGIDDVCDDTVTVFRRTPFFAFAGVSCCL